MLEGMVRHLQNRPVDQLPEHHPQTAPADIKATAFSQMPQTGTNGRVHYGYDVQFLVRGQNLPLETIRQAIDQMGSSTLVVGTPEQIKVHVHVDDPGRPLTYGAAQGQLADIIVENMDEQVKLNQHRSLAPRANQTKQTAAVAIVPGTGLAQVVESLGAIAVANYGPATSLSLHTLLTAIEQAEAEQVVLLPNHKNLISLARQVISLTSKDVTILPTHNMPQGINALLVFDETANLRHNMKGMGNMMNTGHTIEITQAAQAITINQISVKQRDFIAWQAETVITAAATAEQTVLQALAHLEASQYEVLTLYYGLDITAAAAQHLGSQIAAQYPALTLDVLAGGQLHHLYIISIE
jgi:dihydroxyacetone kinase-like predicted kinase